MPTDVTLTLIVFVPLVGAMVVALLPVATDLQRFRVRTTALFATAIPLAVALFDVLGEVGSAAQGAIAQPNIDAPWLRGFLFQMDYHLGVDGLSLMLLFATTAVFPALVLSSWRQRDHYRTHFALLLLSEVGLTGALATQDLLLFVVFFTLPVIPLAVLVGQGGRPGAGLAARRLLRSQLLGSGALLLAALLTLLQTGGATFNYTTLATVGPPSGPTGLIVAALLLFALASRMAVLPLQRWLVDAVAAAPTPVGMLLVLASMPVGGYGLIRILLGMDPKGALQLVLPVLALALVTTYWAALAARGSRDIKRATVYLVSSSGGPVLLGLISFSETSLAGALWICFAFSFFAPLAVLVAGAVADRGGAAALEHLRGRAAGSERLRMLFLCAAAALLGVPLLAGFPGIFQVLVGSFVAHRYVTALMVFGLVVLGVAAFRLVTAVFWGVPAEDDLPQLADAHGSELYAGWWLAAALVTFGLCAGYFIPYTVHGTDLVAARVSSMAAVKVPKK